MEKFPAHDDMSQSYNFKHIHKGRLQNLKAFEALPPKKVGEFDFEVRRRPLRIGKGVSMLLPSWLHVFLGLIPGWLIGS